MVVLFLPHLEQLRHHRDLPTTRCPSKATTKFFPRLFFLLVSRPRFTPSTFTIRRAKTGTSKCLHMVLSQFRTTLLWTYSVQHAHPNRAGTVYSWLHTVIVPRPPRLSSIFVVVLWPHIGSTMGRRTLHAASCLWFFFAMVSWSSASCILTSFTRYEVSRFPGRTAKLLLVHHRGVQPAQCLTRDSSQ